MFRKHVRYLDEEYWLGHPNKEKSYEKDFNLATFKNMDNYVYIHNEKRIRYVNKSFLILISQENLLKIVYRKETL